MKFLKNNWILIAGVLFCLIYMTGNLSAAEQFVGVGGGFDFNDAKNTAFDFSHGIEINDGQWLSTTARINNHFTEFTEDFIQEIVRIKPLNLDIVGIGSVGATSGNGTTKFDFGGGVGGIYYLERLGEEFKDCGIFVGAKFMRNDFHEEDKSGGLSRLVVEFIYRFGGE